MLRLTAFLFFLAISGASAQTTFILVRHAEKEGTSTDPNLTKEGEARAQALVRMFEKQHIDAIYSTNFNRTKNTVRPLADSKGLPVITYEREPDLANAKGTVVICGHSNTIPALANKLIGKDEFANFADNDFGNILIIKDASVTHLRY